MARSPMHMPRASRNSSRSSGSSMPACRTRRSRMLIPSSAIAATRGQNATERASTNVTREHPPLQEGIAPQMEGHYEYLEHTGQAFSLDSRQDRDGARLRFGDQRDIPGAGVRPGLREAPRATAPRATGARLAGA